MFVSDTFIDAQVGSTTLNSSATIHWTLVPSSKTLSPLAVNFNIISGGFWSASIPGVSHLITLTYDYTQNGGNPQDFSNL